MPLAVSDEVLVAVTTFEGSRERALILQKVLRHFRLKNRRPYRVLPIIDGHLRTQGIDRYVDYKFSRRRSPGMYPGEYLNIRFALEFATAHGFPYLLKVLHCPLRDAAESLSPVHGRGGL